MAETAIEDKCEKLEFLLRIATDPAFKQYFKDGVVYTAVQKISMDLQEAKEIRDS